MKLITFIARLAVPLMALAIAAPASAQTKAAIPASNSAEGIPVTIGMTYTITSSILGMERRITVRLPYGYSDEKNADRVYPAVYLIDGGPEQDYPHLAGIAQLSDTNPAYGEFILVGVETVNRRAEITPTVADIEDYKDLGAVPGGSEKFRDFLRREVKPWVNKKYRTNGRDVLTGESLAGLFTMETFLRQPGLFTDYVSVSPSMWWEEMEYGKRATEFLEKHGASDRSLRIYIADEGYWQEEGALKVVEALEANTPKGLHWGFFDLGDTETHKTIFHGAALDAIRALFPLPDRNYRPHPSMSGIAVTPRTDAMQARADVKCDLDNSRPTTPGDIRKHRDATFYECVLYDYGVVPSRGNLAKKR